MIQNKMEQSMEAGMDSEPIQRFDGIVVMGCQAAWPSAI